jgi:hypothetical protein
MLAVRQWMAARLQDRLRRPPVEKKNIPRVECPQDPDQRRRSIAAVIEDMPRDDRTVCDSEEEDEEVVVDGRADTAEAPRRRARNSLKPKEQPTRRRSMRNCVRDSPQSLLSRNVVYSPASQAEASSKAPSETQIGPSRASAFDPRLPSSNPVAVAVDVQSSLKRKCTELGPSTKRAKAASHAVTSANLPTSTTFDKRIEQLPPDEECGSLRESTPALSLHLVGDEDRRSGDNTHTGLTSPGPRHQVPILGKSNLRSVFQRRTPVSNSEQLGPSSKSQLRDGSTSPRLQTARYSKGRAPTLQNNTAILSIYDPTKGIRKNLDIGFDQLGNLRADGSFPGVSQYITPVIAIPKGHELPSRSQQEDNNFNLGTDNDGCASLEAQEELPNVVKGCSSSSQPSIGEQQLASDSKIVSTIHAPRRNNASKRNGWATGPDYDCQPDASSLATLSHSYNASTYKKGQRPMRAERRAQGKMIDSLVRILGGDLGYDYVLDELIPRTRHFYQTLMAQSSTEDARCNLEKQLTVLHHWAALLSKLRKEGFLSQIAPKRRGWQKIIEDTPSKAAYELSAKFKELESWFVSTVKSWHKGDDYSLSNFCHDLATLFNDSMRENWWLGTGLDGLNNVHKALEVYNTEMWHLLTKKE